MHDTRLLIFGLGYTGAALAEQAVGLGLTVSIVSRDPAGTPPSGAALIPFDSAEAAISDATHLVATAAPGEHGDPVLARWGGVIGGSSLRWAGYLSSTGVYGNRDGGWVDEASAPAPSSERAARRLAAEQAWRDGFAGRALDIFRLAGIYGPGRSAFDDLRSARARRVSKPGHLFGRIHRDDIAGAVLAAIGQSVPAGVRVLNLADDEPAASADVIAEAARLIGLHPPAAIPFDQAFDAMSPMARSFWADDRRVCSAATKRMLGRDWLYPSYREGLRAILQEAAQGGR